MDLVEHLNVATFDTKSLTLTAKCKYSKTSLRLVINYTTRPCLDDDTDESKGTFSSEEGELHRCQMFCCLIIAFTHICPYTRLVSLNILIVSSFSITHEDLGVLFLDYVFAGRKAPFVCF